MPTRYPVNIPGFENQKIELESSGFFSPSKLLIDGKKAEPGAKKNEVIIPRRDGKKVSVYFQSAFFDTVPRLLVDGKKIIVVPPLQWYQYVISGLSLFLIIFGGALGAIIGITAFLMGIRIFRSAMKGIFKYLIVLSINALALIIYIGLSLLITVMTTAA